MYVLWTSAVDFSQVQKLPLSPLPYPPFLSLHFLPRSRVLVGPVVMAYLSDAGYCLLLTREDTRAQLLSRPALSPAWKRTLLPHSQHVSHCTPVVAVLVVGGFSSQVLHPTPGWPGPGEARARLLCGVPWAALPPHWSLLSGPLSSLPGLTPCLVEGWTLDD